MPRLALVLALFLAAAGTAAAQSRPAVDLDVVMQGVFPPAQVRPEFEQILVGLIDDSANVSDTDELADYYNRLAELYWAQHRNAKARGDAKSQQEAKGFLIKGVKAYRALVDNARFAKYPKLDRVLFLYGYLLYSANYMKEARGVFDLLLKNFPNSSFVPDAYAVMGDYFFAQNQLEDARAFYRRVMMFPKAGVYPYAAYKLGYVALALQQPDVARASFEQAANVQGAPKVLARAAQGESCRLEAKAKIDLAAADRADVEGAARRKKTTVIALTTCEEAELVAQGAAAETMTGDDSVDARIRIASRYRIAGRYDAALPLLVAIVEKYPMNRGAELAANLILDTLVRMKEYDRVLEWVDRFANDKRFLDGRAELQKSIELLRSRSLRRAR